MVEKPTRWPSSISLSSSSFRSRATLCMESRESKEKGFSRVKFLLGKCLDLCSLKRFFFFLGPSIVYLLSVLLLYRSDRSRIYTWWFSTFKVRYIMQQGKLQMINILRKPNPHFSPKCGYSIHLYRTEQVIKITFSSSVTVPPQQNKKVFGNTLHGKRYINTWPSHQYASPPPNYCHKV